MKNHPQMTFNSKESSQGDSEEYNDREDNFADKISLTKWMERTTKSMERTTKSMERTTKSMERTIELMESKTGVTGETTIVTGETTMYREMITNAKESETLSADHIINWYLKFEIWNFNF